MLEILRSAQDDIGSAPAVFEKIDSPIRERARNQAARYSLAHVVGVDLG